MKRSGLRGVSFSRERSCGSDSERWSAVLSAKNATRSYALVRAKNPAQVVLDNLSTHSAAALYQTFAPAEARRILKRLEFHYTPKHASWLNMVEIEIGVMVQQCLDRRIPDKATLVTEVAAWEQRRNAEQAGINWLFTVDRARTKMGRVYPQPARRAKAAA